MMTHAVPSSVLDVDLNNTPDVPTASFGQAVLARVEAVLGRTNPAADTRSPPSPAPAAVG